jgi:hypothetical protein
MKVTVAIRTGYDFSYIKLSRVSRKSSIVSGIYLIILSAAKHALVLTRLDADFIYFLTSKYTDLHISLVDISAIAVKANAVT